MGISELYSKLLTASLYHSYFLRSEGESETPTVACIFFMVLLGSIDLLDPSSFTLRVCFCTLLQFCLCNLWVPCFLACPVPFDVAIALHFSVLLSLYCPAAYPLEVCLLLCLNCLHCLLVPALG